MANFSKACPQGSEMISTFTPGLASSKVLTIYFRVSVRSGLVITSTSLSVVSARACVGHQGGGGSGKQKFSHHGSLPSVLGSVTAVFDAGRSLRPAIVTGVAAR